MASLKDTNTPHNAHDSVSAVIPLAREHLTQREYIVANDKIATNTATDKGEQTNRNDLSADNPLTSSQPKGKHRKVEPLKDTRLVADILKNPQHQANTVRFMASYSPEDLAVEAAIAIVINGIHYAVLMASPCDLEYLALGFLFSEGLIQHSRELIDWEITHLTSNSDLNAFTPPNFDKVDVVEDLKRQLQDYDAYVVELTLNQRCHQRIQAQRRQLSGRTGCGMCGITGLKQALPDLSSYVTTDINLNIEASSATESSHGLKSKPLALKPELEALLSLRRQIDAAQKTHQLTGAVHAAATLYNQKLYLFEDVGRHNALDKLIGWQLRQGIKVECVVMTSRLSIELVQKAVRCQIPWLVGMSAPTSTAVRVAQRYGLGLAGFLRDNRVTYYSV